MVKYTGWGLVVKQAGVLSKVQMLNLVLGVGVFSSRDVISSKKIGGPFPPRKAHKIELIVFKEKLRRSAMIVCLFESYEVF